MATARQRVLVAICGFGGRRLLCADRCRAGGHDGAQHEDSHRGTCLSPWSLRTGPTRCALPRAGGCSVGADLLARRVVEDVYTDLTTDSWTPKPGGIAGPVELAGSRTARTSMTCQAFLR